MRAACLWLPNGAWMWSAPWTGRGMAGWRSWPSARRNLRESWGSGASRSLEFRVRVIRQRQRASIASAQMEAAELTGLPSLVLRSLGPEETLWDLAKHCRSTVPMILAANGLEGEEDAEAGHLLLVPRKRP